MVSGGGETKLGVCAIWCFFFVPFTEKSEGLCGAKGAGELWMDPISSESSPSNLHFGHGVQGLLYKL